MKNFVRLSKNEMKMVLGGDWEEQEDPGEGGGTVRTCGNNDAPYNCEGSLIGCLNSCVETYGNRCSGCTGN
ncbi:hypothetical protein [Pedobacter alpinus]|uniref:Bacteriocin-type signal sequence-containing protein n=1 Tax=Pedobacter alpinus TaxID=1590643 RepID=A0ABW5TN53_9SPHI